MCVCAYIITVTKTHIIIIVIIEQPLNSISYNLLDDFVFYLQALDGIQCLTSSDAALRVAATVLEVIQGPCEGNQDYFALNTGKC